MTAKQPRIMYIEFKGRGIRGRGRIGRVRFSDSGRTIYYGDRSFQSLKGGYKANYYDVKTGDRYWISGCKKNGVDTLYSGVVAIDDDVREEYWLTIRNQPERVNEKTLHTVGKYTKRGPK